MNILHMKYAVEVARLGSLNKAADSLLIAQPNISRSIKELEASLGITIFARSSRGMVLTEEGEEFIGYAREILRQIEDVEMLYKRDTRHKRRFSVCVPRTAYVSEAFARFSLTLDNEPADIFCREAATGAAIDSVLGGKCALALIRYPADTDKYFKEMLDEKGLVYELVAEFSYSILTSRRSPLASKEKIHMCDLSEYIEVACDLPYNPTSSTDISQNLSPSRRIMTLDRAGGYELLRENPNAYMWVSPVSPSILEAFSLTERSCEDGGKVFRDMLIYKNGYKLSRLDHEFITALCDSKRSCFGK